MAATRATIIVLAAVLVIADLLQAPMIVRATALLALIVIAARAIWLISPPEGKARYLELVRLSFRRSGHCRQCGIRTNGSAFCSPEHEDEYARDTAW